MSDSEHKHAQHSPHVMNDDTQSKSLDHAIHPEHAGHDMTEHSMQAMPIDHTDHRAENDHIEHNEHAHHADHSGHEQMFRRRFWGSLLLSVPVLFFSPMIQEWLGFTFPTFAGSEWIPFVFSVAIFAYGGLPFIQMAVPEIRNREPGMMTLISLAISVAFVYSLAAQLFVLGEGFFWELVTLIDIMLLGHWLEMRSVRQASGALSELAKLMPDTAERVHHGDMTETVPVSVLAPGDVVLVRPGASIPADGQVVDGKSSVNEYMVPG
jgi:Cu2+-exporting ATPase